MSLWDDSLVMFSAGKGQHTHMQSECYQPMMVVDLIACHRFQLASSVVVFGVLAQLAAEDVLFTHSEVATCWSKGFLAMD